MLQRFGDFLSRPAGFWFTMALTAACTVSAPYSLNLSTYVLSVIAIILPSIILVHDKKRDEISQARDKAMHAKLDELIRAVDKADDHMAGIEKAAEAQIEA